MEKDWLDYLFGAILTGGLFFMIKSCGYFIEKFLKSGNKNMTIAGNEYVVFNDKDGIIEIGSTQSFTERQMKGVVDELKDKYTTIKFTKGNTRLLGTSIAKWENGLLTYSASGKEIKMP